MFGIYIIPPGVEPNASGLITEKAEDDKLLPLRVFGLEFAMFVFGYGVAPSLRLIISGHDEKATLWFVKELEFGELRGHGRYRSVLVVSGDSRGEVNRLRWRLGQGVRGNGTGLE